MFEGGNLISDTFALFLFLFRVDGSTLSQINHLFCDFLSQKSDWGLRNSPRRFVSAPAGKHHIFLSGEREEAGSEVTGGGSAQNICPAEAPTTSALARKWNRFQPVLTFGTVKQPLKEQDNLVLVNRNQFKTRKTRA